MIIILKKKTKKKYYNSINRRMKSLFFDIISPIYPDISKIFTKNLLIKSFKRIITITKLYTIITY